MRAEPPCGQAADGSVINRLIFVRYDEVNDEKKQAHTEYQCVERCLNDKMGKLLNHLVWKTVDPFKPFGSQKTDRALRRKLDLIRVAQAQNTAQNMVSQQNNPNKQCSDR